MTPDRLRLIKLLLAPLLLAQGWWVRRKALRLPEAQGPREGVAGTGPVGLRLLIVGDSSAAGVGAKNQTQALAGRLSEALSQRLGSSVVWQLVARSGDSTQNSLAALSAQSVHPADVMVTAIGLNDLLSQVPAPKWLARLDRIDRLVMHRAGVKQIIHCGIPPIHSFPLLPNPLRWVLGMQAQHYNLELAAWIKRWPERRWLPLPFENEEPIDTSVLMAEDGFHPGPAVYALWAEQLAGVISSEIVPYLPATQPTRRRMRSTRTSKAPQALKALE